MIGASAISCYNRGMRTSEHPLYHTWSGMVRRCTMETCGAYPDYGGIGTSVYEEWAVKGHHGSTEPAPGFLSWLSYVEEHLGDRPEGHTLDRIDSTGNYEPGNIRWADIETQNRNRRSKLGPLRHIKRVPSGRFQVNVTHQGAKLYLGTYDKIEEASAARDAWLEETT